MNEVTVARRDKIVARLATYEERFFNKIALDDTTGCWLWLGRKDQNRYGIFGSRRAAKVSWELRYNEIVPDGLQLCHKCDNPPCVNPDHLFLGTALDNARDKMNKGRHVPRGNGPDYPAPEVVSKIEALLLKGYSRPLIAKKLGVRVYFVDRIWKKL